MMPHGINLPPETRKHLAALAYAYRQNGKTINWIANEIDVADPTARNLISYGRRLAAQEAEAKMERNVE